MNLIDESLTDIERSSRQRIDDHTRYYFLNILTASPSRIF